MGVTFSQFFPPPATLTEKNLPSQKGKVFIVTGGSSGIGYHLASILYKAGGKVYVAGRSETKTRHRIATIKSSVSDPSSAGEVEFLFLELDDLSTIRSSVETFKAKETRLDVLWNNAGVSLPPLGSVSKQGYELQLATNCLGPYLFTQLLLPCLKDSAQSLPPGSVRVVWTSSQWVDLAAPKGGLLIAELTTPSQDQTRNYGNSKVGNCFLAGELARKAGPHGILSVAQNPGNLKTNLLRHTSKWLQWAVSPLLYEAKMGAYTELWAGLSPELTIDMNGADVIPWGRIHPAPRKDLLDALECIEAGGTGQAAEFWYWCEKETAKYR